MPAERNTVIQRLNEIGEKALVEVGRAGSSEALEHVRVSFLGKKGALSEVLKGLGSVEPAERPKIGAQANEWKRKIESAIEERKASLQEKELQEQVQKERIDISLPSRLPFRGARHPLTQTMDRIVSTFRRIGFDVTTGPEIETEFLNFDAVNILKDHPARDMQDTFFMGPGVVLRTHTTSVQMRTMRERKPPVRILCPGAVYRADNDATHSPMFHQIEGLWVDQGVTMADMKGALEFFARETFGSETKVRLRASYFPFVEPGAEVDVSCFNCRGKASSAGCRICKGTGWIEILGAGMVHPRLFEMAGYSEEEREGLSGFAFGMGVERVAMLLHAVPDLRLFFQNDVRFLSQF